MKHVDLTQCIKDTTAGHHRVIVYNGTKRLYYYNTEICTVYDHNKTFTTLKARVSVSTQCAIGKYRNYLTARGYKELV